MADNVRVVGQRSCPWIKDATTSTTRWRTRASTGHPAASVLRYAAAAARRRNA